MPDPGQKYNRFAAALQAPSAGCQLLYTIIDVFCADCRKWLDFYREAGLIPREPGSGDLLLAVEGLSACVHNHTCTGLFMRICVQEDMEVQV